MSITRGTTPTIDITIDELDFDEVDLVKVTFKQYKELFTKSNRDGGLTIHDQVISIPLNEQETLAMQVRYKLEIQVRGTFTNGGRWATNILEESVLPIILDGEIDP